ncbi:hypothetical protein CLAIMM_14969 [Cladophialophora immunda]|nr:hypothetical protein CLAIMM_14969 [Cladophialophora immunda]
MHGSHLCHHGFCINPLHILWALDLRVPHQHRAVGAELDLAGVQLLAQVGGFVEQLNAGISGTVSIHYFHQPSTQSRRSYNPFSPAADAVAARDAIQLANVATDLERAVQQLEEGRARLVADQMSVLLAKYRAYSHSLRPLRWLFDGDTFDKALNRDRISILNTRVREIYTFIRAYLAQQDRDHLMRDLEGTLRGQPDAYTQVHHRHEQLRRRALELDRYLNLIEENRVAEAARIQALWRPLPTDSSSSCHSKTSEMASLLLAASSKKVLPS